MSKAERLRRINGLLESFGLRQQADSIIGTPIRKGISGGQKRRVSVASQLITAPRILFLDEPTSGLDSAASWEVMSFIKDIAKKNNLIVIASIHQPSTSTFQLFDKVLLLSGGKSHYFGSVENIDPYFRAIGLPVPLHTNPAEFIIDLMNIDFSPNTEDARRRLDTIETAWTHSPLLQGLKSKIQDVVSESTPLDGTRQSSGSFFTVLMTLVHRSFIKSYRDVVAYGVRVAMYIGLAIMMGTVWLRLSSEQTSIQPMQNAIVSEQLVSSFNAPKLTMKYSSLDQHSCRSWQSLMFQVF